MSEFTGWLLDIYDDPQDGAVLWFLGEDGVRYRLHQPFPITFYAAGSDEQLRVLWRHILTLPIEVSLARTERVDLFREEPVTALAVQIENAADQPRIFYQLARQFPDLTYYDVDIPIAIRYEAVYDVFPLARCRVVADDHGRVRSVRALDSPWDLDHEQPPLRILTLEPDCDPYHDPPTQLNVRFYHHTYRLPLEPARALLTGLRAILERHDPDLLFTAWGDTWLLPYLVELSAKLKIPLPLSREPGRGVIQRQERSYFTYGQVLYRGRQVMLYGRWHIDARNAMMFADYRLQGVFEQARVTGLPVQTVARNSPGSGITAMQIITALRRGVLVPWHKQQVERPKSALDFFRIDQGGLVYQPTIGLHKHVAEIDFISMYPAIMVHFNISPETVGVQHPDAHIVPDLGEPIDPEQRGLIAEVLEPLLNKRIALKHQLATMDRRDCRFGIAESRSQALKWLLVVCFGYLGYKNARFGRIESHQAVTAYGREVLLQAKEAAEDLGYTVLHMYVDGLWVRKDGARTVADFQPLLDEISERTRLPISLDGIYRWVAFLPSRMDARVPVANRYFGVFQEGRIKTRGVEARRDDTPPFIIETQMHALELLAKAEDADGLPERLPAVVTYLQERLADLRARRVPLEQLVVTQRVSRELEEYRVPSAAARAAMQLVREGKSVRPGQRVRFLHTYGDPGVHAWDLPPAPDPAAVDVVRYGELFLRAASTVLVPLGIEEETLRDWLFNQAGYVTPPGVLSNTKSQLPLWSAPYQ